MHKDMRKKGEVSFDFSLKSTIKQYIEDNVGKEPSPKKEPKADEK